MDTQVLAFQSLKVTEIEHYALAHFTELCNL